MTPLDLKQFDNLGRKKGKKIKPISRSRHCRIFPSWHTDKNNRCGRYHRCDQAGGPECVAEGRK